ncbi:MAG: Ppx/GppA family phosphatase [Alloprevotella sp.]
MKTDNKQKTYTQSPTDPRGSRETFNLAAIDIGSNAARLLIKTIERQDGQVTGMRKSLFLRIPLRLGMDVFADGRISEEREEEFLRTMKAYKQLMKVYHVRRYRACATSAMRDACNGAAIIADAVKATGLKIEVISGDEESQIVYDNHLPYMTGPDDYLYVDVGGGSTEVTWVSNGEKVFSHSYNIGTIRMLRDKVSESVMESMLRDLAEASSGRVGVTIVGSGGNINKLCRISAKKADAEGLFPVTELRRLYDELSQLSVEERMSAYGFKPDRADVIVPAAYIFLSIAERVSARQIMVPKLGLADGIINDLLLVV